MIEIPEPLVAAVRAGAALSDIPAQGFPELRDHILHGASRPDDETLTTWLENQHRAHRLVDEFTERLPAGNGLSPHHLEWWYQTLLYPWAEDLVVAVTYAFAFVDA